MKVYSECAACFLRQGSEAINLSTDDEDLKLEINSEVLSLLAEGYHKGASSNKLGTDMHRLIKEKSSNHDPYHDQKVLCNNMAKEFLPIVHDVLDEDASLENHVKVAIVGNILDFGALGLDFNLKEMINENLRKDLAINDIKELEKALNEVESVLYLADNTGEIVFDKLLIEKIKSYGVDVTLAVKDKPILNDACLEDAKSIGLDKITNLITIGTDSVGIVYEYLSDDFKEVFDNSKLIISKGLGNYEGITEVDMGDTMVFSLLSVKCSAIAKDIGVEERSNVLMRIN